MALVVSAPRAASRGVRTAPVPGPSDLGVAVPAASVGTDAVRPGPVATRRHDRGGAAPAPASPLGWVLEAPAAPPTTVTAGGVGAAAWFALHRDGVVLPVWGDLARPGYATETPLLRALSLAPLVPERGVVARASAAWVHTGHDAPARVDVLVPARARRPDPHPLRIACEAELEDGDVTDLGAVRVTSVQRTAVDVARLMPAGRARATLRRLVDCGLDAGAALDRLGTMSGQRGVREGRRLLLELT